MRRTRRTARRRWCRARAISWRRGCRAWRHSPIDGRAPATLASRPMFSFTYVWPHMGLGAALLLALLLATDALRSDRTVSRRHDLVWLAWAGTLAHLVHQFEEHGVDAEGADYAFRGFLCAGVGFADPKA